MTENREEKSCLKEILSELNETVAVHYLLTGPDKDRPGSAPVGEENRAELLFPAFYEEAVEIRLPELQKPMSMAADTGTDTAFKIPGSSLQSMTACFPT